MNASEYKPVIVKRTNGFQVELDDLCIKAEKSCSAVKAFYVDFYERQYNWFNGVSRVGQKLTEKLGETDYPSEYNFSSRDAFDEMRMVLEGWFDIRRGKGFWDALESAIDRCVNPKPQVRAHVDPFVPRQKNSYEGFFTRDRKR
jgi:hypothetical protein